MFKKMKFKHWAIAVVVIGGLNWLINGGESVEDTADKPEVSAKAEETKESKPAPKAKEKPKKEDPIEVAIKGAPLGAAKLAEVTVNDHMGTKEEGDRIAVVFFEQTGAQSCDNIRLNIANIVNEAFRGSDKLSEITVKGRVNGASVVWATVTRDEYEKDSDGYMSKNDLLALPEYGSSAACN
jgi:hypothetical protein